MALGQIAIIVCLVQGALGSEKCTNKVQNTTHECEQGCCGDGGTEGTDDICCGDIDIALLIGWGVGSVILIVCAYFFCRECQRRRKQRLQSAPAEKTEDTEGASEPEPALTEPDNRCDPSHRNNITTTPGNISTSGNVEPKQRPYPLLRTHHSLMDFQSSNRNTRNNVLEPISTPNQHRIHEELEKGDIEENKKKRTHRRKHSDPLSSRTDSHRNTAFEQDLPRQPGPAPLEPVPYLVVAPIPGETPPPPTGIYTESTYPQSTILPQYIEQEIRPAPDVPPPSYESVVRDPNTYPN